MSYMFYTGDIIHWCNSQSYVGVSFRKHGPCEIHKDGRILFAQGPRLGFKRLNGPSQIMPNGSVMYTDPNNGQYHRANGPAKIFAGGSKEYWVHGIKLSSDEFFLKYGVL